MPITACLGVGNYFHSRCGLCDIEYDFIGKTETFSRDLWHIVTKAGLDKVFSSQEDLLIREHSTSHRDDRTERYMAQLSPRMRKGLLDLYWNDFILFDYEIPAYMNE